MMNIGSLGIGALAAVCAKAAVTLVGYSVGVRLALPRVHVCDEVLAVLHLSLPVGARRRAVSKL